MKMKLVHRARHISHVPGAQCKCLRTGSARPSAWGFRVAVGLGSFIWSKVGSSRPKSLMFKSKRKRKFLFLYYRLSVWGFSKNALVLFIYCTSFDYLSLSQSLFQENTKPGFELTHACTCVLFPFPFPFHTSSRSEFSLSKTAALHPLISLCCHFHSRNEGALRLELPHGSWWLKSVLPRRDQDNFKACCSPSQLPPTKYLISRWSAKDGDT